MLKSQDMLPDVDAGIFLDNDMLVLQDPALLWDEFKLFTPFTAMAVAPVEAHYSREMVSSEQNNRRGKCICKISATSHFAKKLLKTVSVLHILHRPQKQPVPYFGIPGLGLNAGVALMNLTRSYLYFYIPP